jgi:hypothetical protein
MGNEISRSRIQWVFEERPFDSMEEFLARPGFRV